jgi:hypothetical protein
MLSESGPRLIDLDPGERRFCKYLSPAAAKAVLSTRSLRWTTPGKFNDPFDVQFDLSIQANLTEVKAQALSRLWRGHVSDEEPKSGNALGELMRVARPFLKGMSFEHFCREFEDAVGSGLERGVAHLPRLNQELRAKMADSKILCVSEVLDSLPMWAYYAQDHRGVVLRFKTVPGIGSPWHLAEAIRYCEHMPLLCDEEFLIQLMSGAVSFDVRKMLHQLVYSKALGWSHEREWRLFAGSGRNPTAEHEDVPFDRRELDAVFIGCRASAEDREFFCKLVASKYPDASIAMMCKSPSSYALDASFVSA